MELQKTRQELSASVEHLKRLESTNLSLSFAAIAAADTAAGINAVAAAVAGLHPHQDPHPHRMDPGGAGKDGPPRMATLLAAAAAGSGASAAVAAGPDTGAGAGTGTSTGTGTGVPPRGCVPVWFEPVQGSYSAAVDHLLASRSGPGSVDGGSMWAGSCRQPFIYSQMGACLISSVHLHVRPIWVHRTCG